MKHVTRFVFAVVIIAFCLRRIYTHRNPKQW